MENTENILRNSSENGRTRKVKNLQNLPRIRNGLSTRLIYITSFIFALVSLFLTQNESSYMDNLLIILSVPLPTLILIEIFLRILHFIEEYQHLLTRYENNLITLLKDVFYFSSFSYILFVCCIFTHIIMSVRLNQSPFYLWYKMGLPSLATSLLSALFLINNLNLKSGPLYSSLWIENSNGLDYGSGLAHSFFHGYIKLITPKTGTSEKHLEELMKDYEDEHHIKLEFYKLFILIPKSLYCQTSLKDDKISPSIEESTSLRPKVKTVAGVQDRVYKNSVYKIRSEKGKRVYVCAEYATPLKTFSDVVSYNGEHSESYKKHKNDIVLHFYLTLRKVLKEHVDCTNNVELIYYDDIDENGSYKDVGQVLLNRIRKLKKQLS